MIVERSLLIVWACSAVLACGGGASAPAPVGKQDPVPDTQQPKANPQDPVPDPQTPRIGVEEPAPSDPGPPQSGAEGGASASDD